MKRLILIAAGILFLSGCATTEVRIWESGALRCEAKTVRPVWGAKMAARSTIGGDAEVWVDPQAGWDTAGLLGGAAIAALAAGGTVLP